MTEIAVRGLNDSAQPMQIPNARKSYKQASPLAVTLGRKAEGRGGHLQN